MRAVEHYAGFRRRVAAQLLDGILLFTLINLIFSLIYGADFLSARGYAVNGFLSFTLENIFPFVATVFLWVKLKGTPGKLLMSCNVLDIKTRKRINTGKAVIRYIAYLISLLPLGLGFLWIIWDSKKQGFHDKIAGTIVVMEDDVDKTLLDLACEL